MEFLVRVWRDKNHGKQVQKRAFQLREVNIVGVSVKGTERQKPLKTSLEQIFELKGFDIFGVFWKRS